MTTEQNPTATTAVEEESPSRDDIVRRAYSKAGTTLRDTHREEFNELVKGYAAEEGVEWSPKKTKEEKAREEFERLLAEHPEFAKALPQG